MMTKLTDIERIWMGKVKVGNTHLRLRPSQQDELGSFAVENADGKVIGFVYKNAEGVSRYEYWENDRETYLGLYTMELLVKALHTYYTQEGLL
jgi:hypothetical protein